MDLALSSATLRGWPVFAQTPINQLNNSVKDDADPKVHEQPQINPVGLVLSRRRQVRHQQKEVHQVADHNRYELFCQLS